MMVSQNIMVRRQITHASPAMEGQTRQQAETHTVIQKCTYEQLKQFWDEHQTLRHETGVAFEQASEALHT